MELFDKELQAAHFQLLSESTNSQLAMVSIQNIAKYVHLLFALATNCSQLSLLISWLVKYDSRYSVLRFCDSFYAEQPLSVFDSSIRPPTKHCPLCLAQRHSCELARLAKEDSVFSGESTAGSPLYHLHHLLFVIHTSRHKTTDTTREYLIIARAVRYSNPSCWNFCHKLFNAAVISWFTVSYWWGNNQSQQSVCRIPSSPSILASTILNQ